MIGELDAVLKEAAIFNIQQRIAYILRIQKMMFGFERNIKRISRCCGKLTILNRLMVFRNDGQKNVITNNSLTQRIFEWFKTNSEPEIEFLETSEKDISDYFNEAKYDARVFHDYILNKMNENEYKLNAIAENIETQRIEQLKKINDIDLSVSKNEKQLSDISEHLLNIAKKHSELENRLITITNILMKKNEK